MSTLEAVASVIVMGIAIPFVCIGLLALLAFALAVSERARVWRRARATDKKWSTKNDV